MQAKGVWTCIRCDGETQKTEAWCFLSVNGTKVYLYIRVTPCSFPHGDIQSTWQEPGACLIKTLEGLSICLEHLSFLAGAPYLPLRSFLISQGSDLLSLP